MSTQEPNKISVRPPWDSYFIAIANQVATRSTCARKHVGAVITRNNRILATGYNGSIPGAPHCDDVGHLMVDNHCIRTVHAEANAILQAARHGVSVDEGTIYTTASPCWACFQKIVTVGLERVVFVERYGDSRIHEAAGAADVELVQLTT